MSKNIELLPEFYDNHAAKEKYLSQPGDKFAERTKHRKIKNSVPLEDYLISQHNRIKRDVEALRSLCEMYVTMHRRFRGVTISDQFGYFGTRRETAGRWIDYDPDTDGEVHPINIVRPDIRANQAALLKIRPTVTVSAASMSARARENARRIEAMVKFFERQSWTENDRLQIFDGIQKEGVYLVENYKQPAGSQTVLAPDQRSEQFARYHCQSCGQSGNAPYQMPIDGQEGESALPETLADINCPSCGNPAAAAVIESVDVFDASEQSVTEYDVPHRLHSAFNFAIDRKSARRDGIKAAKYLRTHEIISRSELEARYPQFEFDAPFDWSYPLKCQHALATNDWSVLYTQRSPDVEATDYDEFEIITICLHEDAYANYVAPADWEYSGADGQIKLSIKRGEYLKEAVYRHYGEHAKGFRFVIVNDRLVDIINDEQTIPNFRDAFTDIHFLRDSASFHSVPHWDSKQLQDDITLFNTLKTETAARNAFNPVWYNSEIFDIDDFGKEFIPSKNGVLAEEVDIRNAVFPLPAARSSDQIMEHLSFLLQIRSEVSSVTPALRGEAQPNQPYAAQRQQLEQSFGILNPTAKSFVQMFIDNIRQKIRIAFDCFTIEQFQHIASATGDEWNEDQVRDLVATDLDKDVIISYAEGTEQPQGKMAIEMTFYNALQQLMPFIQGGAIAPEVIKQIVQKIDELGNIDLDLSGLEKSDALAQKRYETLVAVSEPYGDTNAQSVEQLKTMIVDVEQSVDPATGQIIEQPITQFDLMLEELTSEADLYVSDYENVEGQSLYFIDRIREELTKTNPNYVLIELLSHFVKTLIEKGRQGERELIAGDPQMQAQQAEAQAEAQARTEAEAQARQAEAEAAEEKRAADMEDELTRQVVGEASKENDRNFEREKLTRAEAQAEAERAHQAELAAQQSNNKNTGESNTITN